jgi:hypothetical protein
MAILEVDADAFQEIVFGLYQLVLVHVVDVGGTAAAGEYHCCSSRREACEVLQA